MFKINTNIHHRTYSNFDKKFEFPVSKESHEKFSNYAGVQKILKTSIKYTLMQALNYPGNKKINICVGAEILQFLGNDPLGFLNCDICWQDICSSRVKQ